MSVWEDFEISSSQYLNETFGEYATFTLSGGSDSTKEDILVSTLSNKQFYIEAKHSPAQCGQFVLLPNLRSKKFDYSLQNYSPLNEYSQKIIDYMNSKFEEFKEAGTAGKIIDFVNCQEVFLNWIINFYKNKGVKFFITNDNTIIPIDSFGEYFNINAKYRIKRSGSSSVGLKNISVVKDYLSNNFSIEKIIDNKDKLFIQSSNNLHNLRFIINGIEYMISKRGDIYEIRRLSNTFNANVIFSVHLKDNKDGISITEFIKILIS